MRSENRLNGKNMLQHFLDDHGQMMTLEVVFFATTVILSLVFIYNLSPPSVVTNKYSSNLKIMGDDALRSLYTQPIIGVPPKGYPNSRLVHYLITNDYGDLVSDLNDLLPSNVMYNIYVSNGTNTMVWCNSQGGIGQVLPVVDPVTVSHYVVSIDPSYLTGFSEEMYMDAGIYVDRSDLCYMFGDYDGSVYDVMLEMWYT
ncbi:MAG: hypothetical protein DRN08_04090 [Thermoplasmata archaeon]|nr:MAG: hypothetical protein DRN05_05255 [Thermoplasmata archaeon]RLF34801.1 MAG: hypothetical protein DRN08_04090 [Thermoplasmata archaeon]